MKKMMKKKENRTGIKRIRARLAAALSLCLMMSSLTPAFAAGADLFDEVFTKRTILVEEMPGRPELAQKELGDAYRTKVTAAHLELVHKDDISRFAKLGVNANYSVWWHYGDCVEGSYEKAERCWARSVPDSCTALRACTIPEPTFVSPATT